MSCDEAKLAMLEEWMRDKEGENLEFKKAERNFHFDSLGRYCAALANEGGGKIILGVTDQRPRKAVGILAFEQPERTRKGLCERIPLAINFEEIHHPDCSPGSRVLVFHVPRSPVGMPTKFDGKYWMRKEDSLVEMSDERLKEIILQGGHDFSQDVCPGALIADLDSAAVEAFRERWIAKVQKIGDQDVVARLSALSQEQLLIDAEVIIGEQLTYAALILFGTRKALGRFLAQAEVVFEYRSSDAAGAAQERKEYRQGFFGFYDDLWERINKRNDTQDFQEGLFVTPISTFSERAVREAILNAVSHRNYQLGGSVFVRQYPRRLEIDSPGSLPTGITLENILDRQNPRNRRVAEILTKCGLVERSGQGMNLIFEEMIKQSKPIPDFSRTDQFQLGLTLHGTVQDPAFVRFVEKVGKESTEFFNTQDWLVFSHAGRGEKIPKELQSRLPRLLDLGLIEKAKGRSYILGQRYYAAAGRKGEFTRKRGLDRETNLALLLRHIEENKATGAKLEELCQVLPALSQTHVQSLLRSLKKRRTVYSIGVTSQGRWFPGGGSEDNDETVSH